MFLEAAFSIALQFSQSHTIYTTALPGLPKQSGSLFYYSMITVRSKTDNSILFRFFNPPTCGSNTSFARILSTASEITGSGRKAHSGDYT